MRVRRRIISILLILAMLLGLLSTTALAEEGAENEDIIQQEETEDTTPQGETGDTVPQAEPEDQEEPEGGEDAGDQEGTGVPDLVENKYLTRAGLAVMLCANKTLNASMQEKADKDMVLNFSDIDNCSEEQKNAITLLVQAEILQGNKNEDGTVSFDPGETATRGMAAVVIYRALGGDKEAPAETQTLFTDIEGSYVPAVNAHVW